VGIRAELISSNHDRYAELSIGHTNVFVIGENQSNQPPQAACVESLIITRRVETSQWGWVVNVPTYALAIRMGDGVLHDSNGSIRECNV